MKFVRTTKCSLKFCTQEKRAKLKFILNEYAMVVNFFIDYLWDKPDFNKNDLLKPIVDLPKTWFSFRMKKVAAREAVDMILAAKTSKANKPKHYGKRMCVSSTIGELIDSKKSKSFDSFLQLRSIGNKIKLDLPIKKHKHFNKLFQLGKRLNYYIVSENYVQFCFEIKTEEKKSNGELIGVDSGINALASLSNGKQYGEDIKPIIDKIKQCKYGSKHQKSLRRSLKQRMDEVSKEIFAENTIQLLVVEQLKQLNNKSKFKRRLNKNMRRSIGIWAYRYWLNRLQQGTEWNRVSFRSVYPAYTSQICSKCGYTDRKNRSGDVFKCLKCSHSDNADINAALNILERFITGPYGAGFRTKCGHNRMANI